MFRSLFISFIILFTYTVTSTVGDCGVPNVECFAFSSKFFRHDGLESHTEISLTSLSIACCWPRNCTWVKTVDKQYCDSRCTGRMCLDGGICSPADHESTEDNVCGCDLDGSDCKGTLFVKLNKPP